ncbi:VWA domain-containing protein [Pseudooceanicola sp. 216_PA32_1]|uniref:VWA domain-containing protein n=1 Tax=Pseudooceanicola pacificus TaxID=2676438 RepID=A0A844W7X6_9RHOB|nr:VWA domain-containing protein [Pseudooceanicola pacificus]MWB78894.1 VWA domain-containing protein [Pseudooceanicola pacificus]
MFKQFVAACLAVLCLALPARSQDRSMIVLDGSGSMWGQIDGVAKITIARDTLRDVLAAVPEGNELGLMVYGHRRKGDCADIELAVPAGRGTAGAISDFAAGLKPKGKTPLSAAVKQAAEQMRYTEDKATVILVTDGLETCDADPCALGAMLEETGVDFTAHVVGFGLTAEEGAQVSCLAEETGGRYIEASNAATLGEALTQTVVAVAEPAPVPEAAPQPAPEPEPAITVNLKAHATLSEGGPAYDEKKLRWELTPVDANDKPVGRRAAETYNAAFEADVPAGRYLLFTRFGGVIRERIVELNRDALSEIVVNMDAGLLTLVPKRAADQEGADKAVQVKARNGDVEQAGYGESTFLMPAGDLSLLARHAAAEVTETVTLAAGQSLRHEMIVSTGVVLPHALYSEAGPAIEDNSVNFRYVPAEKPISGKRRQIGANYGSNRYNLPAGDYQVLARLGSVDVEGPLFTVHPNQLTEVTVNLDAGVLHVSAPGGYQIRLLTKDMMTGKERQINAQYGEEFQRVVPAGTYIVDVRYKIDKADVQQQVSVKAGTREEVTVE